MLADLTVAAVQLTSTQDVEKNLSKSVSWVRRAAQHGAALIVLPENYGFLGRDEEKLQHAHSIEDGSFTAPLRSLAKELSVHILAGSIPETGPDAQHTYNTSVLIGPKGETAAIYRKVHLFDVDLADGTQLQESASVAPGDTAVVSNVKGWTVGLSVCYDLRFPEYYRALLNQQAQILTVPAAFTLHTGKDHWDVLLRARAIENQCYVIASGQFGHHGDKRSSWGKSQIIDPWGTVLAMAPEREGFTMASLNASDQQRVRRELPCLGHRRF
ncbi:MAG: carbon-nitrogen hydrolase family protein [Myxococcota bacterium]